MVAWHDQPVGVDIERVQSCRPEFAASISTPAELARGIAGDEETISLWCGKEALAKALGDALSYDPRRLLSPVSWLDGRAGPWRAARREAPDGHVVWLCWHEPAPGERRQPLGSACVEAETHPSAAARLSQPDPPSVCLHDRS